MQAFCDQWDNNTWQIAFTGALSYLFELPKTQLAADEDATAVVRKSCHFMQLLHSAKNFMSLPLPPTPHPPPPRSGGDNLHIVSCRQSANITSAMSVLLIVCPMVRLMASPQPPPPPSYAWCECWSHCHYSFRWLAFDTGQTFRIATPAAEPKALA